MASDHPADLSRNKRKKPANLDEFVGLTNVKRNLRWRRDGARRLGHTVPHMVFTGAPGGGKTTLANAFAAEMGVTFVEVTATVTAAVLIEVLLSLEEDDILYIDEAHLLRPKCYDILNKALLEWIVPDAETGGMKPIHRFTLIASTNRFGELNKAFRSRLRPIDIPDYTLAERTEIAVLVGGQEGFTFGERAAERIARVSRTPRLVEQRVQMLAERYPGAAEITLDMAADFLSFDLEIDNYGLTQPHRAYLRELARRKDLWMSQPAIIAALGMGASAIKNEIEPDLLRHGLIEVPRRGGRILTPKGRMAARWKAGGAS